VQTSGLEQNRYAIKTNDGVDLLSVERDNVAAAEMFNVRAGRALWRYFASYRIRPLLARVVETGVQ
jgi:hypothetical protein